jgi:4,5-DOPA dioxygenase extradiol
MTDRMPTIFFGHGNPMLTLSQNVYTRGWSEAGKSFPRPKAVLAVSAHWWGRGLAVTSNISPETMHDFYGFPRELFEIQYRAPGSIELASRVGELLAPQKVFLDENRGLDHGVWAVLRHVFRSADVPIVQLSIDAGSAAEFHYEIGRRLAPLRDEGVLIVGSGNIVHNLSLYSWEARNPFGHDWAQRFDNRVRALLAARDDAALIDYENLGPDARLSIPTPEHYLPLLYVLGAGEKGERPSFPVAGMEGGSMSMLAVRLG